MPQAVPTTKTCPACSKVGIGEHSALIQLDPQPGQPRSRALGAFTRCSSCGATFRFAGPDRLEPEPSETVSGRVAWIIPPWAPRNAQSDFELSWDAAERTAAEQTEEVAELVSTLRSAGLGPRVRIDLRRGSLVLSRSRRAELRPEQQFVAMDPQADGAVKVRAKLARELGFGPVPAAYGGDLKLVVDALLSAPVD
ncbi:MAG: hypothetical protein ACE37F_13545 [Nannocystaceae bacterium]|nr:hypothetical protein [bacterium]